eukprot:187952_1
MSHLRLHLFVWWICFTITEPFHVERTSKTWWDADQYCQTHYDTHLITITDSTINANVFNSISSTTWIGISDAYAEGIWKWVGYNQSSYSHWESKSPDNAGGLEDCGAMRAYNGYWRDYACSAMCHFACAEESDYPTVMPTTSYPSQAPSHLPTPAPTTQNPTTFPSIHPTINPIEPLYDMKYKEVMRCENLANSVEIRHQISKEECIHNCQQMSTGCRMINYFNYFKTSNDSRCYVFDHVCIVKLDAATNRSMIAYKMYHAECVDYPLDWSDSTGDVCDHYKTYNWCNDGNLFRNENEYYDLMDTTYGLTAIQTCCECDGGVNAVDDVWLSYDSNWNDFDNDVICARIESDVTQLLETRSSLRNWDSLMLYEFCDHFNDIDCEYLINAGFVSNDYDYTLYVCDGDDLNVNEKHFVFGVVLDDARHATYINTLWCGFGDAYYSANITIHHVNHSQCIQEIASSENTANQTYRYGVHACSIWDSVNPTIYPTLYPSTNPFTYPTNYPSKYPTNYPSKYPTNYLSKYPINFATIYTTNEPTKLDHGAQTESSTPVIIIALSCVSFVSCCGVVILAVLLFKNSKQNDDTMCSQIEMNQNATAGAIEGNVNPGLDDVNETNQACEPSAPVLCYGNVEQ